jgi:membrane associated rhomboid family serine protease
MSVTFIILCITCVVSFFAFSNAQITSKFLFNAVQIDQRKEWWRMITSGFIHGDFLHLFINMLVLFSFGQAVEYYYFISFGTRATFMFILLYITAIPAANMISYYKHRNDISFNSVGASGAVSAVVFVSILYEPFRNIYLYGLIGLPGIVLGGAYLLYSYYMANKQSDRINHDAHFWGAVYGIAFTTVFNPKIWIGFFNKFIELFAN